MKVDLIDLIEEHNLEGVRKLLSLGANPNMTEPGWPGLTALDIAIGELDDGGSMEMVKLLLDFKADVNGWDAEYEGTSILTACFRGRKDVIKILLKAGADPNVRGSEGDSPLRWYVDEQDIEMVKLLLDYGAGKTINEVGEPQGLTALGIAVKKINIPMIEILLDNGADTKVVDEYFQPAYKLLPRRTKINRNKWNSVMKILKTIELE